MKFLAPFAAIVLAAGLTSCSERRTQDQVTSGAHGTTSPEEAGLRPDTPQKTPDTDYQTAGLTGELSNGKTDETMEGSGNLAWQGSYEREKRANMQAGNQPPSQTPNPAPQAAK